MNGDNPPSDHKPRFELTETRFGFAWGPAHIIRCVSDKKYGVILEVRTGRQRLNVRVTPTGVIRTSYLPRMKEHLDG